jgi:histidinol phosphatase-like enzyme
VSRNFFSERDLIAFNQQIEALLEKQGITIRKTYYCPHLKEDGCLCHKPSPFFLYQAQKEFDIDLKRSFVIGDHPHDVEMAHHVGARSVYVLTGHGKKHRDELNELNAPPDFIASNLYEASLWIGEKFNVAGACSFEGGIG